MSKQPITSVFWPSDQLSPKRDAKLVVLGYRINPAKVVVISLVPWKAFQTMKLENAHTKGLLKPLSALATVNFSTSSIDREIQFDYTAKSPTLSSNELLVIFHPPDSAKLEYLSIDPIDIDIFWTSNDIKSKTPTDEVLDRFSAKLEWHFPDTPKTSEDSKELLRYINLTEYSRSRIIGRHSTRGMYRRVFAPIQAVLAFWEKLYVCIVQRACWYMNKVLEYPFFVREEEPVQVYSLALVSHTLHQANSRLKQLYNLPYQLQKLRSSRAESETLILKGTKFSPTVYIKFYNTVWVVLNDMLLGVAASTVMNDYGDSIISAFTTSMDTLEQFVRSMVVWLTNSPAGFKLNNELALFFGELILWVINFWVKVVLQPAERNAKTILSFVILLVKYGGISMLVAVTIDVFELLCLEMRGFYVACTRIYYWQCHTLMSLFRLFLGKKYNVLRHRIDSNAYDFDELMSGIVIFTILLYLLPTVAAFYFAFCGVRLAGLTVSVTLEFVLIGLNHLPLGVILLRFKNKERLPAGVTLSSTSLPSTFELRPKCLSLKDIWRGHFRSMANFNLTNYNEVYPGKAVSMGDILANWKRLSPAVLSKEVLCGERLESFEYKRMF